MKPDPNSISCSYLAYPPRRVIFRLQSDQLWLKPQGPEYKLHHWRLVYCVLITPVTYRAAHCYLHIPSNPVQPHQMHSGLTERLRPSPKADRPIPLSILVRSLSFRAECIWWSWRESNPRPKYYFHSRITAISSCH